MIHISTTGRVATVAVAAALALSTVGTATAATSGELENVTAKKGMLDWGVKESFRDYVEGPIADGGIDVFAPAKRKADGTFRWAKGRGKVDVDADTATIKFKGAVYFYGHDVGEGPTLEITVDKPRIVIDGDDSFLIADVTSRVGGDLVEYDDVELVEIDASSLDLVVAGGKVNVSGLANELTAAGAEAFGGFYAEGTPFDPISFKVKLAS